MSVSATLDIWCEHPGCHRWEHGVVLPATIINGRAIKEARDAVNEKGWRRRSLDLTAGRRVVDLCPSHSALSTADLVTSFNVDTST